MSQQACKITIEDLLKQGWQIAGYTGAVDNWSTFVLLPGETHLIQCRLCYDVTRELRVQTHCYSVATGGAGNSQTRRAYTAGTSGAPILSLVGGQAPLLM